jgi:hypothetical protein
MPTGCRMSGSFTGSLDTPQSARQPAYQNYVVPRAKKPNHFLMQAWSFAVFARKLSLQALRQKRRPQWWWQTRPDFLPQFAQRFSNLVIRLSEFGGRRAIFVMSGGQYCDEICHVS